MRRFSLVSAMTRARFTQAAAVLWLAFTVYETMRPIGWIQYVPFWAFFTESMAGVDAVQNVVLFAPFGWIAHRAGWSIWRSVLVAFLVSAAIEFAQQWVPGRTSTAMDLACNSAGAALGWWLATRVTRPRLRLGLAFVTLGAFVELHVLNTSWPSLAERADGSGAWASVTRAACPLGTRESTVCITVPNTAQRAIKYVLIVGPEEQSYARVQGGATGRLIGRKDCTDLWFESTLGATLHLRPPLTTACDLADTTEKLIDLQVNPRLAHDARGAWTPVRVGVWLWPVWPFTRYRPAVLRVAGALAFVVLSALIAGAAPWILPAGYLVVLEGAALLAGLRPPGLWDIGWALVGWLAALVAVWLDQWWAARASS